MTLKEELEILRGEPIQVFTGDPMDIPCIETSNPERLCKHPVVSVHMITYNHEPYIRQAIEGVMMQKTDFEFELVIGEDCSTDKTREICFEYQKRYPDKIRVLWCDHNLYRNPHPAGGNSARNLAHCRGEFIAFCEGDDYWIDPLKLQKQVDVMRKCPNVGLCFCGANSYNVVTKQRVQWSPYRGASTLMSGMDYNRTRFMIDRSPELIPFVDDQLRTLTTLIRGSMLNRARSQVEILRWRLCVGDYSLWSSLALVSDVYFLDANVGVYRIHPGGATSQNLNAVRRDCSIIRGYFLKRHFHHSDCAFAGLIGGFLMAALVHGPMWQHTHAVKILINKSLRSALSSKYEIVALVFAFLGLYCRQTVKVLDYLRSRYINMR